MSDKNTYQKLSLPFALLLFIFLSTESNAAPGDLDSSFGDGGRVATVFSGFSGASGGALQTDGKIVAVGYISFFQGQDFAIARYHADGSLDATFGNGGTVTTSIGQSDYAASIAIQTDGRIVVAGSTILSGTLDFAVVRYNANGTLDASFDGDGKAILDLGNHDFAQDLVIQPDGKIIVIGGSGVDGSRDNDFAAARLNSDGSLDASFNNGGIVITSLGGYSDSGASAVTLQSDGKIIVAGQRGVGPGFSPTDFALARYKTDGTLDASFDGDGIVITHQSSSERISDVSLQPDGKIVAVGDTAGFAAVLRYNPNGSLDTTFGTDGIVQTDIGSIYDTFTSVALQSDGKIVAGGFNFGNIVARYNSNGSPDASFGSDGIVSITFYSKGRGSINDLAMQPDGKIVSVGSWGLDGEFSNFSIARFISIAVVSNSTPFDFDGDGKSDISVFRPSDRVWYLNQSTAGFFATQFGLSTDKITPADFDGDGKTDIAVYRVGTWYWLNSSNGNFNTVQFGLANDIPVPADFTGDGRAELAVYRGGNWFTLNLANNQFNAVQFGITTDKPAVGDYDGDSRADYAVYRDGVWYLLRSSQGFAAIQFGLPADKLVPADYDGDGKTDIAVFRDGVWYVLQSVQGFTAFQFGISTDVPAPADYDGDGRTDAAVFRDGVWYLRQSANGFSALQFGLGGDKPVPTAYLP